MTAQGLLLALPEILVLTMACVVMLADLYLPERRGGRVHFLSLLTLGFAALTVLRWQPPADGSAVYAFEGTFVRDHMGDVLKLFAFLVTGAILVYGQEYLRRFEQFKGEFYALTLFLLLGAMVLISAANLISVYLGVELIALCSYALIALNRNSSRSAEAAMKYFVLGSLASGLLLYGMSLVYGVMNTLDLAVIAERALMGDSILMVLGLVFIVIGVAFKLGAVPFHMWLPDVYHGATAPVTVLIGSVPKIAGFAMAVRLLQDGLVGYHEQWSQMLTVLSALSLIIGNLVAIAQTNLKRMLAYSTIGHMGFLLMGLLPGTASGYGAAMFYAITYAIMNAGAFGVIILLSRSGEEAENLDDFKGLGRRSPWFALVMLMLMFSMAGVPVFVGFFAKWLVIQAAIEAQMLWLAILAVVTAVIGAFYYLRVVKLMYFDEPESTLAVEAPAVFRAVLSVNGLAQLLLGIFSGSLITLCLQSF